MITSWFKQLLSHLKLKTTSLKKETDKELSERVLGQRLCGELKQYLGRHFDPGIASSTHISCVCADMQIKIELLKEINATLRKEDPLRAERCYFTNLNVNMDSFFHTKDGYYISHARISDYCKEAELFYTLTEACETAQVGVYEHNNRMLMKFYVSLKNVTAGLIEVLKHSD